jgi:hypothetical protein
MSIVLILSVELYNRENFKKKIYLDEVVRIASHAIKSLEPAKGEMIEVCGAICLNVLKIWLEDNGYRWYSTQITGRIQEIVERSFELYTESLGLPWQYIKYTRYPFHFHKLLRWVYADFDNRIKAMQGGWKSWQKIEAAVPEITYAGMCAASLTCMKCGRHIKPRSEVKVIRFVSNRENYVYLHGNCESGKGTLPTSARL